MSSNQWQRIEELFHAASRLPAEDRAVFLNEECSGDDVLLHEVESLIAASADGDSFIERPAMSLGLRVLSSGLKGSLVGQSIGHYKIVQVLGEGGMGEVYLADDCILERRVALKFLAPWLVDDAWAKEQLMKEARAVARLENPNICGVYGLEEIGGYNFIVMQYVEGETLASLLGKGPLDFDQALDLAEQIVSALSAAHRRGIIHRDIKPQNIVVTAEGQAKVLDFGLARFVQPQGADRVPQSLEDTSQRGLVLGTISYMSPEQAQGDSLDCRTDIFSFGIVLYQMLAGKNPFLRQTREDTLVAIANYEPPQLVDRSQKVPGELARIVSTCLQKNRLHRFETTDNLLADLHAQRKLLERPDPAVVLARARRRRVHLQRYALATLVLFILVFFAAGVLRVKFSTVHSLALLPIINKTADSNVDYLSDGLTRNLVDKFSYLPRLKLKAPSMLTAQAAAQTDVVKLGRDLKVEAVLSGEIIKQGDSVRLRLEMLNTSDGSKMWEQDFDLTGADLFVLQNDITARVTSSLGLWLLGDERKLLSKRQTDNKEALALYMRGRYYWGLKRSRENIQTAVTYFEQAVALDPSFAKAYTGLADCYVIMPTVTYGPLPTKEAMDRARYNARQALEIDSTLPEAHTSLAIIKLRYEWDWPQAEQEFKRAIEINPDYAPAHYWNSNLLAILGRFDESIKESEIAGELDPYSPLSAMNYGRALYYARRYEDSAKHFRKLLEENPDYPQFLQMMGLVLIQLRQYPEAIAILKKLHATNPAMAAAPLGYAYGKADRGADAVLILRELDDLAKEKPVSAQEKAIVHMGMGDIDRAFEFLEDAYHERFAALAYLTTDPLYDDLRTDPRFTDLAHRIGLPR